MKALGLVVSDKKIFESIILKPIFWPRDLLMQPTGTVWSILIGDYQRIIPVKFGQLPICGSREDVVWSFPYIIQCKIVILKTLFFTLWSTYATNWNGLNYFDRGPPRDHSCEVWSKFNKRFQRRCCLKKMLTHARTVGRTDDGRRTLKDDKSSGEVTRAGTIRSAAVTIRIRYGPCQKV